MTKFLTVGRPGPAKPVLLWDDEGGTPKVVARYAALDEAVDDAGDLEVWRFEKPVSSDVRGPVNEGNYPVVDADGAPLWEGARIRFRVPTHHVNSTEGSGVYSKTDSYGGSYFLADEPMNVYGRGGIVADRRAEQYTSVNSFVYDNGHPLASHRVMASKLGDPFEHGQETMYVRLDDDPRKVCRLERSPSPRPGR